MSENPKQKSLTFFKEDKFSNSRQINENNEEKPFFSHQSAIMPIEQVSKIEDQDQSKEIIKYTTNNDSEISLLTTQYVHCTQQIPPQTKATKKQNIKVLPTQRNPDDFSQTNNTSIHEMVQQQLTQILRRVDITEEQEIKTCLDLFNNDQIQLLQSQPDDWNKPIFKKMLNALVEKIKKLKEKATKEEEFNVSKQLIEILKKCGVESQQKIQQAQSRLQNNKIDLLKSVPPRIYRPKFKELLDDLLKRMDKHKSSYKPLNTKTELINILNRAEITKEQQISICLTYFEDNNIQQLKQQPDDQFRQKFSIALDELLERRDMELIKIMKKAQIDVQDKNIVARCCSLFKERRIQQLQSYSPEICRDSFLKDLESLLISVPQKNTIRKISLQPINHIQVREKQFKVRYQDTFFKIKLRTNSELSVIKQTILKHLQKYKRVRQFQFQSILSRMMIKFLSRSRCYEQSLFKDKTIEQIEDQYKQAMEKVEIYFLYRFTIYYNSQSIDIDIPCNCNVLDLKRIISEKYIPVDAQQLTILRNDDNSDVKIEEDRNQQQLSQVTSTIFSEIILRNKSNTQFYGFQRNYYQEFQKYSELFLSDPQELNKMIQSIDFTEQNPQNEKLFIDHFFLSVHEAIKRQFSINFIIKKYKQLVRDVKNVRIWVPLTSEQKIKINESFVLTYLLHNSDLRLRIHLIHLVKEYVPIPLYLRKFDNIYQVTKQLKLMNQILWTLKKGYVVASLGLHTKQNFKNEKGKSLILNQIFYTNFTETQHKQLILKEVPFIAISIFNNHFPLHIIDIPHDSPQSMINHITNVCDMLIIQSWKNSDQTNQYIKKLRQRNDKIQIYCLYRDQKVYNNTLNIPKVRYNTLRNLKNIEEKDYEIKHLKEQIFEFIEKEASNMEYKMNLVQIFQGKDIYLRLMQILDLIKQKMLQLTPICQDIQIMRNSRTSKKTIDDLKKTIGGKLSSEIKSLIVFLLSEDIRPHLNIMLNAFRQNLKFISQQMNLRFQKIYSIKKKCQKHIDPQQIFKDMLQLKELAPDNSPCFQIQTIKQRIELMINNYQNKIRPQIFSMELFWRQLIHLTMQQQNYQIQDILLFDMVKKMKSEQITSNFPFQVVDGDLLEVPSTMLVALFQNNHDRAIVMTIIGPQSSGKSTLLNFLFGCDFSTSEGRCTRGIYGTYFKFGSKKGKFSRLTNCDGILVLDTEGLFALTNLKDQSNSDRKNFDSKLIMFCLAVSDFVIINVCKNYDSNTNSLLRLCNERLEDLEIKDPSKKA